MEEEKKNNDENEFNLNDAIKSLVDQTNLDKDLKWKKMVLIGSLIGLALLIILVVILVVLRSKGGDEQDDVNKENLGNIECVYHIESHTLTTNILGSNYQKGYDDFDIFIEKEKIKYTKKYTFEKAGTYKITYRLYSKINLDYMFKDVETITSCIFFSQKKS